MRISKDVACTSPLVEDEINPSDLFKSDIKIVDEAKKLADTEALPCNLAGSGLRYFKDHPLSNTDTPRVSGFPLPTFKALFYFF